MRKLIFIVSVLVLTSCQYHNIITPVGDKDLSYLPLEVGNAWDFQPLRPLNGIKDAIIHREVMSTTTINNRQYYLLVTSASYNSYADSAYYRIDGDGFVYIYRKSRPNFEDKRFWLSAINGNAWTYPVDNNNTARISATENSLLIGTTAIANCKSYYFDVPIMADEENTITLAPGIGFVKEFSDAWGLGQILKSAKIHGEVYNF